MSRAGLQVERTGLAWQRTALAAGALSVLLIYYSVRDAHGLLIVVAALTGAAAAVLALTGAWRERALRHDPGRSLPPAPALVVTVLVTATAVTAFAALLA